MDGRTKVGHCVIARKKVLGGDAFGATPEKSPKNGRVDCPDCPDCPQVQIRRPHPITSHRTRFSAFPSPLYQTQKTFRNLYISFQIWNTRCRSCKWECRSTRMEWKRRGFAVRPSLGPQKSNLICALRGCVLRLTCIDTNRTIPFKSRFIGFYNPISG